MSTHQTLDQRAEAIVSRLRHAPDDELREPFNPRGLFDTTLRLRKVTSAVLGLLILGNALLILLIVLFQGAAFFAIDPAGNTIPLVVREY